MEDQQQVGIGTVVIRDKQHLAALRPLEGMLAMSTMVFADEVVPRSEIDDLPRRGKVDPKALKMAVHIIEGLSTAWEPKRYRDTYTEALRSRIAKKQAGKEVVESVEAPEGRVLDLDGSTGGQRGRCKEPPAGDVSSPGRRGR